MRSIRGHALVNFLSPVEKSLDGLHICLALVSTALIGVGRRGGFSFHIFPDGVEASRGEDWFEKWRRKDVNHKRDHTGVHRSS